MTTRPATRADAGAIARIYNQGIEDRAATFETRLRSNQDIAPWFDGVHPMAVAEQDGGVIAFAMTSRVGIYRRHGQLDGAWRDVIIVEKLL